MATEPTIRDLHGDAVERMRSSGIDKRTAARLADESLRRVGDKMDKDQHIKKNQEPRK